MWTETGTVNTGKIDGANTMALSIFAPPPQQRDKKTNPHNLHSWTENNKLGALIPSDDWFFRAALSHNRLLHLGSFRLFRLHQGSHSRFVPSYRDSFLYLFTVSELTSLLQNGSFDKIHKLAEARLVLLSVSTHSHYYSFALLRLDGVTKALCKCN